MTNRTLTAWIWLAIFRLILALAVGLTLTRGVREQFMRLAHLLTSLR